MKINICLSQHYVFIFHSDIQVAKGGHNNAIIIIIINFSCNFVYFFNWWPQSIITTSRKMRILRWRSSEFMQIVAELSLKVVPHSRIKYFKVLFLVLPLLLGGKGWCEGRTEIWGVVLRQQLLLCLLLRHCFYKKVVLNHLPFITSAVSTCLMRKHGRNMGWTSSCRRTSRTRTNFNGAKWNKLE